MLSACDSGSVARACTTSSAGSGGLSCLDQNPAPAPRHQFHSPPTVPGPVSPGQCCAAQGTGPGKQAPWAGPGLSSGAEGWGSPGCPLSALLVPPPTRSRLLDPFGHTHTPPPPNWPLPSSSRPRSDRAILALTQTRPCLSLSAPSPRSMVLTRRLLLRLPLLLLSPLPTRQPLPCSQGSFTAPYSCVPSAPTCSLVLLSLWSPASDDIPSPYSFSPLNLDPHSCPSVP